SLYCSLHLGFIAVQRHHEGTARVIPIILKPCSWQYSIFSRLQVLPTDGKPVSRWEEREEAFLNIEEGIRKVVGSLTRQSEKLLSQQSSEAATENSAQSAHQKLQTGQPQRLARFPSTHEQLVSPGKQHPANYPTSATDLQQHATSSQKEQTFKFNISSNRFSGINRRRALKIIGLGGCGLTFATAAAVISKQTSRVQQGLEKIEFKTVKIDTTGQIVERISKQAYVYFERLTDDVGLEMISIPAGEFMIGSPPEEEGHSNSEEPRQIVSIPAFLIGRFPITQAQYRSIIDQNPSEFSGANHPVERVSWNNAAAFCEQLSQRTGRIYRLPSEAEWEYACRADTITPFYFGATVTTDLANYDGRKTYGSGPSGLYRRQTTEVGSFPPNAFGLYDMHGNVWEWCQDSWHQSYEGAPSDGTAWIDGGEQGEQVKRGGSSICPPSCSRSANRAHDPQDAECSCTGFRVVCVLT
ncbi:MAG: formylglycine-generating enzyme family protein, partial [Leptolyngbya sp. SIO4C1]|nr:formylglycine-generating enzyme family protein [Leptolyngbya sp. SIO4C1]